MAVENGQWIMRGLDEDDPRRVRGWRELIRWIDELGFLPLFQNEIPGFPVEDRYFFGLKRLAGSGREREKNFEGTVTDLQIGAPRCAGMSPPQKEKLKL